MIINEVMVVDATKIVMDLELITNGFKSQVISEELITTIEDDCNRDLRDKFLAGVLNELVTVDINDNYDEDNKISMKLYVGDKVRREIRNIEELVGCVAPRSKYSSGRLIISGITQLVNETINNYGFSVQGRSYILRNVKHVLRGLPFDTKVTRTDSKYEVVLYHKDGTKVTNLDKSLERILP